MTAPLTLLLRGSLHLSYHLLLSTTYFLADTLPILSRLSKTLRQSLDFSIVSGTMEAAVSTLESFMVSVGPRLKKFMDDVPASPTGSFYFRDQKLLMILNNVNSSPQLQIVLSITWLRTCIHVFPTMTDSVHSPSLILKVYLFQKQIWQFMVLMN